MDDKKTNNHNKNNKKQTNKNNQYLRLPMLRFFFQTNILLLKVAFWA